MMAELDTPGMHRDPSFHSQYCTHKDNQDHSGGPTCGEEPPVPFPITFHPLTKAWISTADVFIFW